MIDWFLLLGVGALWLFVGILTLEMWRNTFYLVIAIALTIIAIVLTPYVVVEEKFNPETHDCVKQEVCPTYKGSQGILNPDDFVLNAKYARLKMQSNGTFMFRNIMDYCFYPEEGNDVSLEMANQIYKENERRKWEQCVSWQPKAKDYYSQEFDVNVYSTNGTKAETIYVNESYKVITSVKAYPPICPVNTIYHSVICDCAENTRTPCMVECFECIPSDDYCKVYPSDAEKCECKSYMEMELPYPFGRSELVCVEAVPKVKR